MKSRNHELLSGGDFHGSAVIVVQCKTHQTVHQTTVNNYKKAKTGMRCCGKELQSQATARSNKRRSFVNKSSKEGAETRR